VGSFKIYQKSLKNEAKEFIKHFLIKAFLCKILVRHVERGGRGADTRENNQGMWTHNNLHPYSGLFCKFLFCLSAGEFLKRYFKFIHRICYLQFFHYELQIRICKTAFMQH
jgi:hypothetical protein